MNYSINQSIQNRGRRNAFLVFLVFTLGCLAVSCGTTGTYSSSIGDVEDQLSSEEINTLNVFRFPKHRADRAEVASKVTTILRSHRDSFRKARKPLNHQRIVAMLGKPDGVRERLDNELILEYKVWTKSDPQYFLSIVLFDNLFVDVEPGWRTE